MIRSIDFVKRLAILFLLFIHINLSSGFEKEKNFFKPTCPVENSLITNYFDIKDLTHESFFCDKLVRVISINQVSQPFFASWWFRILLAILIISAVSITYVQKVTQVRKNQEFLENQINERTQKLEKAYKELLQKNEMIEKQKREIENHKSELEKKVKERTSDLEMAKVKAEEGDKLKTSFLANMSHEIRTPINAIVGFSNLLDEETVTRSERVKYVKAINENTSALLKLIEDILDISKIESDQIKIKKDLFNLNSLFSNLFNSYSIKISGMSNKKNVHFSWDNKESNSVYIETYSDQKKIKQILVNLIENAIKYTHTGNINFGYKINGTDLRLYVKDTGIGISKADKDIIFNRFVKIEKKSALYRGTGIGLSIAKGLSALMGGDIHVESEEDKGSCFIVNLPDVFEFPSDYQKSGKKIDLNKNLDFHGKSILIVEDEDSNFFLLNSYLKRTGVTIMRAVDGYDAIEMVKMHTFDLILLDIKMPKLNGFETLKIIRKDYPDLPIVAQTAYALTEDKQKISAMGFTDYIAKPIMKQGLLEKIYLYI